MSGDGYNFREVTEADVEDALDRWEMFREPGDVERAMRVVREEMPRRVPCAANGVISPRERDRLYLLVGSVGRRDGINDRRGSAGWAILSQESVRMGRIEAFVGAERPYGAMTRARVWDERHARPWDGGHLLSIAFGSDFLDSMPGDVRLLDELGESARLQGRGVPALELGGGRVVVPTIRCYPLDRVEVIVPASVEREWVSMSQDPTAALRRGGAGWEPVTPGASVVNGAAGRAMDGTGGTRLSVDLVHGRGIGV